MLIHPTWGFDLSISFAFASLCMYASSIIYYLDMQSYCLTLWNYFVSLFVQSDFGCNAKRK